SLLPRKFEVHNLWRSDGPYQLQAAEIVVNAVEQALAAAKQNWSEADHHFVEEPGGEVLLCCSSATSQRNVLAARRPACLVERRLDAVGDERESVSALERQRRARVVCEDENRMVIRWILSPPTPPRFFRIPGTGMSAEHVASHYRRADVGHRILDDLGAGVYCAAFHALHLTPDLERKHPLVEAHPTDAERILDALIGAGDEAVERHRDSETKF